MCLHAYWYVYLEKFSTISQLKEWINTLGIFLKYNKLPELNQRLEENSNSVIVEGVNIINVREDLKQQWTNINALHIRKCVDTVDSDQHYIQIFKLKLSQFGKRINEAFVLYT